MALMSRTMTQQLVDYESLLQGLDPRSSYWVFYNPLTNRYAGLINLDNAIAVFDSEEAATQAETHSPTLAGMMRCEVSADKLLEIISVLRHNSGDYCYKAVMFSLPVLESVDKIHRWVSLNKDEVAL